MLNSTQIQAAVRKTVVIITGFVLSMVLLIALLITGFYLLTQAAIMGLSPYIGQAAAMAVVGLGCILLLIVFFRAMTKTKPSTQNRSSKGGGAMSGIATLRALIRENPLESALAAFALGFVNETDPRLRSLLLQGGMELMKPMSPDEHEDRPSQPSENDEAAGP